MDLTLDVLEWPETLKPMFFSCWDLIMRNLLKEIMFHTTNLNQAPTISRWVRTHFVEYWTPLAGFKQSLFANVGKSGKRGLLVR